MAEIPQGAITLLQEKPELASQFDTKYGSGSSAQYLEEAGRPTPSQYVENASTPYLNAPPPEGTPEDNAADGERSYVPIPAVTSQDAGDKQDPKNMNPLRAASRGAAGGVAGAIDAAADLAERSGNALGIPTVSFGSGPNVLTTVGDSTRENAKDNFIMDTTRVVAQLFLPYGVIGKAMQGFKFMQAGGSATKSMLQGAGKGALAEFIGFKAGEGLMADLIEASPSLSNPITAFLANDADQTELEGRLRLALEGVILGAAIEPFIRLVNKVAKGRKIADESGGESSEALKDYISENADEIEADVKSLQDILAEAESGAATATKSNKKNKSTSTTTLDTQPTVNTDELTQTLLENVGSTATISPYEVAKHINVNRSDTSEAVLETLETVAEANRSIQLTKEGTYSHVEVVRAAEKWGDVDNKNGAKILIDLANAAKTMDELASLLYAGRQFRVANASEMNRAARIIFDINGMPPEEMVRGINKLVAQQRMISVGVKDMQRGTSRATASGRITVSTETAEAMEGLINDIDLEALAKEDPDRFRKIIGDIVALGDDASKIDRYLKLADKVGWAKIPRFYYINALLTNPSTHVVNTSMNMLNTVMLPLERSIGAALGGDMVTAKRNMRQLAYIFDQADAWKGAVSSWKYGRPALDVSNAASKVDQAYYTNPFVSQQKGPTGFLARGTGKVVGAPTRFLAAQDELFKQINYRAALKARLSVEVLDQLPEATVREQAEWIATELKKGYGEFGEALDEEALRYARETTFTDELGGLGRAGREVIEKSQVGYLAIPFYSTPINLLKRTWRYTRSGLPWINRLSGKYRADIAAGGDRAAKARGEMAVGGMLYTGAVSLAVHGQITGGPPADDARRKTLEATDWKPYSFVVTDDDGKKHYYSYARFDPFASILGIISDGYQAGKEWKDTGDGQALAEALVTAMSSAAVSKQWASGLTDMLEAVTGGKAPLEKWIGSVASAHLGVGLRPITEGFGIAPTDPYMREVNSILDKIKSRTPWASSSLPHRINWITGAPMEAASTLGPAVLSPVRTGSETTNAVLKELADTGFGWDDPSDIVDGVKLSPHQYEELLRRIGTARKGRLNLQGELARLFNSERYKRAAGDINRPEISIKKKLIDGVIAHFIARGREAFLIHNPSVSEKVKKLKNSQRAALKGQTPETISHYETLQRELGR